MLKFLCKLLGLTPEAFDKQSEPWEDEEFFEELIYVGKENNILVYDSLATKYQLTRRLVTLICATYYYENDKKQLTDIFVPTVSYEFKDVVEVEFDADLDDSDSPTVHQSVTVRFSNKLDRVQDQFCTHGGSLATDDNDLVVGYNSNVEHGSKASVILGSY